MEKLTSYTLNPDDDNIRFKEKIKKRLIRCPELLYALHNNEYESELFDENGNLDYEGDWSLYFGDNIRPYLFFPEAQDKAKNYLCYKVEFDDIPKYNTKEKYGQITFVVFCDGKDIDDKQTGIARHDLIAAIIREYFNWSNIFGTQCKLVSNKESSTDNDYITKTLIFEITTLNSITKTQNDKTHVINNEVWT